VQADLPLIDDAALALVNKLDRIFDGDDVIFALRLATSMMEARVVDLPLPVGPVTSTIPRGSMASLETTAAIQLLGRRDAIGIRLL